MVKSSSLPANIAITKIHFPTSVITPKLSVGPTSAKAGPTVPTQLSAALNDVSRLCPVKAKQSAVIKMVIMNN